MQFTTPVDIPRSSLQLTHHDHILLLGSCFTDGVGEHLTQDGFDCLVNPYGVLYNPASIAAHLYRCMSRKAYDEASPELLLDERSGLWHSWMHHTEWSAVDRSALIARMNESMQRTARFLETATVLIVTLGTSYVYRLADGRLVANCHKQPDALFTRTRLAAYDIVDTWSQLIQLLSAMNPSLRIILTVSPIRHQRDGLHVNQLSKAELLLAADALQQRYAEVVSYFPSYELLLDELRDYRFYAPDMVHPSAQAVDYIYERFCHTYVPRSEQDISSEVRRLRAALSHRPMQRESEAHRRFVEATQQKLNDIQSAYPHIAFGGM